MGKEDLKWLIGSATRGFKSEVQIRQSTADKYAKLVEKARAAGGTVTIVEKGTKLAAQINRGELTLPPDDETAEKYLFADESFTAAGFAWYELSNWSKPGGECKHNIAYWDGSYWWGVGPGAHSYFNNQRWWNVKHPTQYQHLITQQQSPVQNREQLTSENLADEYLLLQIRRRDGIPHARLSDEQLNSAKEFFALGHFERSGWEQGKLVLSQSGRLLADRIVRALVV